MDPAAVEKTEKPVGWRFGIGVILFGVGFSGPAFIPLVLKTGWPPSWKALGSGLLTFGIPEVFMIAAAAVMGKAGFAYLKATLFVLLKKTAPPDRVGPMRYRIGLVMFCLPLLFGWLMPYGSEFFPLYAAHRLTFNLIGDAMLLTSLFVLGGEFWDKLRALFVRNVRVTR